MTSLQVSLPLPGGRRSVDWTFSLGRQVEAGTGFAVYEATGVPSQSTTETPYIIRVSKDHDVGAEVHEEFTQEYNILRHVDHKNILKLFTQFQSRSDTEGSETWSIYERTGVSLEERVAEGALAVQDIRRIFSELVAAVAYLHHKGVVHRTICPANVRLEDGTAKLTGFTCASPQSRLELLQSPPRKTHAGFVAPEVQAGPYCGKQADVYALGATLRHMFGAAEMPSGAQDLVHLLTQHDREARPDILDVEEDEWLSGKDSTVILTATTHVAESEGLPAACPAGPDASPAGGSGRDERSTALTPPNKMVSANNLALSPGTPGLRTSSTLAQACAVRRESSLEAVMQA
eukprot:TRINITY_DN6775_c0_g1_i3.p1 TRINITY_DN6775_c0_g1~~TRINITY_DN6775_c0_g1_i3.p1  ORF type:complete len:347 (+),score=117.16 TRINITY_DN6775_c0_g1_i3:161-1201(+)